MADKDRKFYLDTQHRYTLEGALGIIDETSIIWTFERIALAKRNLKILAEDHFDELIKAVEPLLRIKQGFV